jgi:hypothetical protein
MSERVDPTVVFSERQPLLPPLLGVGTVAGSLVAFGLVMYLVTKHPEFPPITAPLLAAVLTIDVAISVLLAYTKTTVVVRDGGITMRSRPLPLVKRTIAFREITACEIVPPGAGTFGGEGVRLRLSPGQDITARSRKPEALADAIRARIR